MAEIIIPGRPDRERKDFGVTRAKRFPSHVYSNDANGCLVHKVRHVKFRWYDIASIDSLRWLTAPQAIVTTNCGQVFFPKNKRERIPKRGFTMCELPSADAVLCGRCQGSAATFKKGAQSNPERLAAREKLGCLVRVS